MANFDTQSNINSPSEIFSAKVLKNAEISRTEGNFFSGQIDDVRVYSFALTQDNVTWLNNSGNGRLSKTLGGVDEPEVKTQYSLEIPYTGVVYDTNLTLSIDSKGIPIGTGLVILK